MAKKTAPTPPTPPTPKPTPTTPPVAATPSKKTKIAALPLTPAQAAAQAALDAANAEAQAELRAKSGPLLEAANAKVAAAKEALKAANKELSALYAATGIVPEKKAVGTFKGKHDIYVFVKQAEKGPPQMKTILAIIEASSQISRKDLVSKMQTEIATDMDRKRLLSFYTPKLIELGLVTTRVFTAEEAAANADTAA